MRISSRTPEGEDNRCLICGMEVRLEPSLETHDATCPYCGSLLWFFDDYSSTNSHLEDLRIRDRVFSLALRKFGWPITASTSFIGEVPRRNGAAWLNAVETADSWEEFVQLLHADT